MNDLWVFGYGSLTWRPGFPYLESRPARLAGAHRGLCVYSWVHRGTPERPGLVLGLDRGGTCRGVAFRVAAAERDEVVAYLRAREQVTNVYLERIRTAVFDDGGSTEALTYVVDRGHEQYAGHLDEETEFAIVRGAEGRSGRNAEYVINTALHLAAIGIPDRRLSSLAARLGAEERLDTDQAASDTPSGTRS
ncbi:gamma-glutamylcyclotransferase [Propylenella binzhouense]|uniref:glutathione-specific gamma-glutamylcyclotransferase n=1 Tax=Propylenella binzhouense TaxID=2555902 RepID=A0A964WUK8_9HYPH|nr:gamma-glutamylcyclotransferase [Propylenella binzhouense]MYZ49176.1 gamma-glutamylcyclotransferase [Propylenella binzhouense]